MKYILDGKKMVSREETHVYLKETFGFPDYYGKNLDALHDCLTEIYTFSSSSTNSSRSAFIIRLLAPL